MFPQNPIVGQICCLPNSINFYFNGTNWINMTTGIPVIHNAYHHSQFINAMGIPTSYYATDDNSKYRLKPIDDIVNGFAFKLNGEDEEIQEASDWCAANLSGYIILEIRTFIFHTKEDAALFKLFWDK